MIGSVVAELLVLGKRASTWIVFAIGTLLALTFAYVVPYVTYVNGTGGEPLDDLLPQRLIGNFVGGFPFFGGVLALMLGVLAFGSEYGSGMLKTLLTQRPGRLGVFGAKLLAVGVALVPFVLAVFALGAVASSAIALREGADLVWPAAWLVLRGLGAGWLILAAWAAVGVLLAVVLRGTSLAVGIGILYALVVEGLISALASQVSLLDRLVEFFLRANAYSLVKGLGLSTADARATGPARSPDRSSTAARRWSCSPCTPSASSSLRAGSCAAATSSSPTAAAGGAPRSRVPPTGVRSRVVVRVREDAPRSVRLERW